MMDDFRSKTDSERNTDNFSPFWNNFNAQLTQLYDPVTQKKYNPIQNREFWHQQFNQNNRYQSKYESNTGQIFSELDYLSNMKYSCLQEIIYQSNPDSLNPIISYSKPVTLENEIVKEGPVQTRPCVNKIELGQGWWISDGIYICYYLYITICIYMFFHIFLFLYILYIQTTIRMI